MKSIETKELITAIEELEKERGISKEYLLSSLETALVTAYKRNFDSAENVKVNMDENTGDIKVYAVKTGIASTIEFPINKALCFGAELYSYKWTILFCKGNILDFNISWSIL